MEENNKSTNLFAIASKEVEKEEKELAEKENTSVEQVQVTNDSNNISFNQEVQNSLNSNANPFVSSNIETENTIQQEETNQTINEEPQIELNNTNPFINSNVKTENSIQQEEKKQTTKDTPELQNSLNSVNPFTNSAKMSETDNTKKEVASPFFEQTQKTEVPVNNEVNINPFFQKDIDLTEKIEHQNQDKLDLTSVQHFNVKIEKKKPGKLKFIVGVLSYAIFIWLLLIGATLLVYVANIKIKQLKGDYSSPKYNAYVVLTGSMLPSIKVEDVVVTKKIEPKDLKEGDIITFASSDERFYGTVITHRIKKKYYDSTTKKYTYVSKGDNNNIEDSALVEQDRIYGKVILKIPKLGYLQIFLASKGGWILVILLPCLAVISFDIMKIFKIIGKKSKLKITK